MDIREAVGEAKDRLDVVVKKFEDFDKKEIRTLEVEALEVADVCSAIGDRLEPQICVLGLLRRKWTEKQIAAQITKRHIPTSPTTISRYQLAKKQTGNPKRVKLLRNIYNEVIKAEPTGSTK